MTLSTSTVTLAPGSSRTYSLAPGEAVTVATAPNCYVTVTETPDVISSADLDGQTNVRTSILQYKGEWTYGPYALGGTVAVAVSSTKSTSSVSVTLGSAGMGVLGASIKADSEQDASSNFSAIQAAVLASDFVQVGAPGGGEIYIDRTLIVPSRTKLVMSKGTVLKLAAGSTCQLLRNQNAQNTLVASQFNHSVSGVCTVTENGHSREVGDVVYIENIGGDATLLGVKTITAVSGVTWQFAAAGTGTPTGQGYVAPYVPIAGANFVRGQAVTATANISGQVLTLTSNETGGPVVSGMTVTGGTLSGQTVMGPSGNRQSGSGTLWRLSSSGGTQSGVAVTFTPPATLVRVYEPGHVKQRGDAVYVGGSVTGVSSFTGPIEVAETIGDYWYYHTTGTTAETATGTANVLFDHDITIEGEFDGNYINQINSFTDSLGLIMGNVARPNWLNVTVKNCFKFAIWNFNCSDIVGRNIKFDTFSDGFHCQAPWRRVDLDGVHGNTNDDLTSFANPNPTAGSFTRFSSPSGMGSGFGVVAKNLYPSHNDYSAAMKITGNAGYDMGDFYVDGVYGRCNTWISITDDTASLVGTAGRSLVARNLRAKGRFPNSYGVFLGHTGTWGSIDIGGITPDVENHTRLISGTAGTVGRIQISDIDLPASPGNKTFIDLGAITIGSLEVTGTVVLGANDKFITVDNASASIGSLALSHFKASGPGTSGYVVFHNAGTVSRFFGNTLEEIGCESVYRQFSTGAGATDFYLNNVFVNNGNSGFITQVNSTIRATNVNCPAVGGFMFNCQAGTQRIEAENVTAPAGKFVRFASGLSVSVSGKTMRVDIGASGASTPVGMVPLAGDIVYNTNATGAGLYGRTAAGAWVSIF